MDYLILGNGYVAKDLSAQLKSQGHNVFVTSRSKTSDFQFELEDKASWRNLPKVDGCFWTFPAKPKNLVADLIKQTNLTLGKLVVIGTTGSYLVDQENQIITEASPMDSSSPRLQGEQTLLDQGGILVNAAGIYGEGRNPLDWVKSGRVKRSAKNLNLTHVHDLSECLIKAMEIGKAGSVYISCDSHHQNWDLIISKFLELGLLESDIESVVARGSKLIDSSMTRSELGISLKYKNLWSWISEDSK